MTGELRFPEIPARVQAGIGQPVSTHGGLATDMLPTDAMRIDDGSLAPGAMCVLADSGIGAAVIHGLGDGVGIVTSHLNVEFVGAAPANATSLRCVGRLVQTDGSYALGAGTVFDASGNEIALATVGCVVVPRPADDGSADPTTAVGGAAMHLRSGVDELLGTRAVALTADRCEMQFLASEALANLHGGVHGGMGVLMAERTMDRLARNSGSHRLVAIRAAYPRRIAADGALIACVAEAVHRGRRLSIVSARLHDQSGRPAVIVDGTYAAPARP